MAGDFDLSSRIRLDASGVAEGGAQLAGALDKVDSGARKAAQGATALEIAQAKAEVAARRLKQAEDAVAAAATGSAAAQEKAAGALAGSQIRVASALLGVQKAQDRLRQSSGEMGVSIGQQRAALTNLSRNVQDVTTSYALNVPLGVIFTQQAGQIADAYNQLGKAGVLGSLAGFLAGPFGAVVIASVGILAQFAGSSYAAQKATKAHGDAAKSTEQAILDLNVALKKSVQSEQQAAQAALNSAGALYRKEIATRNLTKAELERAIAAKKSSFDAATSGGDESVGAAGGLFVANRQVASLSADLAKQNASIAIAQQNVQLARVPILQALAKDATDKGARATAAHTREVDRLTAAFVKNGNNVEYRRGLEAANRTLDAAQNADKNAAKAKREHAKEEREAAKATRDIAREQKNLGQILSQLEAQYDPATAAANKYAEALQNIATAVSAIPEFSPQQLREGFGSDAQKRALELKSKLDRKTADEDFSADDAARKKTYDSLSDGFKRSVEGGLNIPILDGLLPQIDRDLADLMRRNAKVLGLGLGEAIDTVGDALGGLGINLPGGLGGLGRKVTDAFGITKKDTRLQDSLTKIAGGVGISPEGAATIGRIGGKAIEGAATGALANSVFAPLAKGLGIKTSKTGAQIGGALGGLSGIPGGEIIGGLLGSIGGGLLKKTKFGSVTLSSTTSELTTSGNSAGAQKAASSLGGSIQQGLQSIADQLGGGVGAFNVTVGQRHGDFRVTTGSSLKVKKGAKDFNDDAEAAAAYAIQLAITQGAVTGLSAAVQKAIGSSSDINKALAEALKVQDVEEIATGLTGELDKAFRTFEKQAADRVRIAKQYGFDLTKIEERNAKDRADLIETTLKNATGSLQDLLTSLTSGDLFEGSATDRRAALLTKVAGAQARANAGEAGAGDELAGYLRQLVETTREAFGTAGVEFGADRNAAITGAEQAIKLERDRVEKAAAAQQQTLDSLKTANELANENNNLVAVGNAKLDGLAAAIMTAIGGGGGGAATGALATRFTQLN